MVKVYDRRHACLVEQKEYQSALLTKLYETRYGRWLQPLVTSRWFSLVWSWGDYLPSSRKKIVDFVQTFGLNTDEFVETTYENFAAFFTRNIKPEYRPICSEEEILAVADAKLQVFSVRGDLSVCVKGQVYPLTSLLQDAHLAQEFEGGVLCLYRLAVEDCHHYLSAETGWVRLRKQIAGKLHSVRALVQEKLPVFKENRRSLTLLETDLGPVLQMEVGALLVGAIHNQVGDFFKRGESKGYFSLGGSSIIVLYPKHRIRIDADILAQSQLGIETQVRMGERIGEKNVS